MHRGLQQLTHDEARKYELGDHIIPPPLAPLPSFCQAVRSLLPAWQSAAPPRNRNRVTSCSSLFVFLNPRTIPIARVHHGQGHFPRLRCRQHPVTPQCSHQGLADGTHILRLLPAGNTRVLSAQIFYHPYYGRLNHFALLHTQKVDIRTRALSIQNGVSIAVGI